MGGGDIITLLFENLNIGLSKFFESLGTGFTGIQNLIMTDGGLTFFGAILCLVMIFGIGWLLFRMVRGLIKMR